MAVAEYASGADVSLGDYNNTQVQLLGRFAQQMIATGPEQNRVVGQQAKNLQLVSRYGISTQESLSAAKALDQDSELFTYLQHQWMIRFASIFGPLAREAALPLEIVRERVRGYQHAVVENIAMLRHAWTQNTGQVLPLQSAWEQVRWKSEVDAMTEERPLWTPIRDVAEGGAIRETYLRSTALFPHVVQHGSHVDLEFSAGHIYPQILEVAIPPSTARRVQEDIGTYRKLCFDKDLALTA